MSIVNQVFGTIKRHFTGLELLPFGLHGISVISFCIIVGAVSSVVLAHSSHSPLPPIVLRPQYSTQLTLGRFFSPSLRS